MATAPTPPSLGTNRELLIVSHSTLFYWWPVWAIGFLMAAITWFDGHHMAVVPNHTILANDAKVTFKEGKSEKTIPNASVLIAPEGKELPNPKLRIAHSKNLGVFFSIVLLLVVTITNVPLRGLWSVIVIVIIVGLTVIFAILGWWDTMFEYFSFLDIRINMGGYLLISTVLLILWLIIFILFDKQIYMVFTPGQLRVRLEIGDAETAYDTSGMTIQKQRSDIFRHWILGLGSGDLIVKTSGAQAHYFDMPNVLFLGRKVKEIEEMLRSKQVVVG